MLLGRGTVACESNTAALQHTTVRYLAYGRNIVQQPFKFQKRQQGHDDPVDGAPMQTVPAKGPLAGVATETLVTLRDS